MPVAARLLLEGIIVGAILVCLVLAYLAAKRREHAKTLAGLMPPDEEQRFETLLRQHERMRKGKN